MMVCQNLTDMNNNQTSRFQQFPISERTVKRLRNYGQFPEDVDTVINRVIDQLESFGVRDWSDDLLVDKRRRFDSGALPDVTFSRLFHARIADKEIDRPHGMDWSRKSLNLSAVIVRNSVILNSSGHCRQGQESRMKLNGIISNPQTSRFAGARHSWH